MAILAEKLTLVKALPKWANIIDNTNTTIKEKEHQVLNIAQWLKPKNQNKEFNDDGNDSENEIMVNTDKDKRKKVKKNNPEYKKDIVIEELN